MTDGLFKAIAKIRVGDLVASRSEFSRLYSKRPVTGLLSSLHTDRVRLQVSRADGSTESILTTLEHPFYVEGRGFVAAGELTAGVILSQHNENAAAVLHLTGRDNA
ncbi:MAG: hypothetical protein DSY80_05875, partial [Desulfocapsa sp.]